MTIQQENEQLRKKISNLLQAIGPLLREVKHMRDEFKPKQHIIAPDEDSLHWEGYSPSEAKGEPELLKAWTKLIEPVEKVIKD